MLILATVTTEPIETNQSNLLPSRMYSFILTFFYFNKECSKICFCNLVKETIKTNPNIKIFFIPMHNLYLKKVFLKKIAKGETFGEG